MASRFLMQIVDRTTGDTVQFEPGLSVEVNFIDDCVTKIVSKGVGFTKTSSQVEAAIRDGIEQSILDLKKKIRSVNS